MTLVPLCLPTTFLLYVAFTSLFVFLSLTYTGAYHKPSRPLANVTVQVLTLSYTGTPRTPRYSNYRTLSYTGTLFTPGLRYRLTLLTCTRLLAHSAYLHSATG